MQNSLYFIYMQSNVELVLVYIHKTQLSIHCYV